MSKVADFILLNLLWLICSLPIFTIGASTTALYAMMFKILKNEEGYLVKGFLKAFQQNFKKSTLMWLIILPLAAILGLDLWVGSVSASSFLRGLRLPILILAILLVSVSVYAFALQARFENTVKNTMKNAWTLTFVNLPYTLLILILTVGTVVFTFSDARTMAFGAVVWLFLGVSLVTWLNAMLLSKIFGMLEEQASKE